MKKTLLIATVGVWAMLAQAQVITLTNSYPLTPNVVIPDANPSGLTETFGVSGLSGSIANIQVNLDITGGFNGDLYAYLAGPAGSGGFAVLLNRVGLTASNPYGYADSGFNITLDDSGPNIHTYQTSVNPGGGQLTGFWAPDGRNIDPLSSGSAFDAASTLTGFQSFLGIVPNGTWTLFIADMSAGGGAEDLTGVTLNIMTVPEPSVLALTGLGLAGGTLLFLRHRQQRASRRG